MKKILIFLIALIVLSEVKGQVVVPPGYSGRNTRENILAIAANAVNITAGDSAQYKIGQWRRAGLVYVDTTGADSGYYYSGSGQSIRRLLELKDTALFSGGGSDTSTLFIKRGGDLSGIRDWYEIDDTLVIKDKIGSGFIEVRTRADSTMEIYIDTAASAFKNFIKRYSASGSGQGFTPGSVLYTGTDGNASETNSTFFWDITNSRLGLGTTAPRARLHASGTLTTQGKFTNTAGSDATTGGFITVGNDDGGPLGAFHRSGGYMWEAVTVAGTYSNAMSIEGIAEALHTGSSTPMTMRFFISPSGSLVRDTVLSIFSNGQFTFEKINSFLSSDTTTYKAIGADAAGNLVKMNYWPGGGGGAGTGDVVGPGSATDNAIAVFDGTTGKLLKNSTITVSTNDLVQPASAYHNFGATAGTSGYGIRDNAGTIEVKNSGGAWGAIGSATDHGALTGLTDDDHTQYPLLLGRSGGQTIAGGTGTGDDLIFKSTTGVGTSSANIYFRVGNDGATTTMTVVGDNTVGIGVAATAAKLHVSHTTNAVGRFVNTQTSSTTSGALLSLFENDGVSTDDTHRLGGFIIGGTIGSTETGGSGIIAYADGAYSAGSAPTQLQFEVAPTGSTTRAAALTIRQSARVGIGTTVPDARFDINLGTAETFQLSYNDANGSAANRLNIGLSSVGSPTYTATGTSPEHIFANNVVLGANRLTASDLSLVNLDVDAAPDTLLSIEGGVVAKYVIPTVSTVAQADSLSSGHYVPTLANVTNVAGTTAVACHYQQIGSYVHVTGVATCTVTAGATFTTLSMTLPIASNFSAVTDAAGPATARTSAAATSGFVTPNTSTDVAELNFYSGTGSHDIHFSFMYKIR